MIRKGFCESQQDSFGTRDLENALRHFEEKLESKGFHWPRLVLLNDFQVRHPALPEAATKI